MHKSKNKSNYRNKRDVSDIVLKVISGIFVSVFTFLCFYPFYFIVINSISGSRAVSQGVYILPRDLDFKSFTTFFSRPDLGQAFFISIARSGIGTLLTVFCCSLLGFLFTKREMFLRAALYRLLIFTMYIGAGLIPWFLTMRSYGLQNNFLLYILPSAVNAFYVILLKTYFEQLPISLEESAELDGAGFFVIFTRIIMPLSTPILATIAVYSAVGQWNAWQDTLFLVRDRNLRPLQFVLYNYLNEAEKIAQQMRGGMTNVDQTRFVISPETVRMTAIVVTVFPVMLVYPFLQKYFAKGIMIGAVKG